MIRPDVLMPKPAGRPAALQVGVSPSTSAAPVSCTSTTSPSALVRLGCTASVGVVSVFVMVQVNGRLALCPAGSRTVTVTALGDPAADW